MNPYESPKSLPESVASKISSQTTVFIFIAFIVILFAIWLSMPVINSPRETNRIQEQFQIEELTSDPINSPASTNENPISKPVGETPEPTQTP